LYPPDHINCYLYCFPSPAPHTDPFRISFFIYYFSYSTSISYHPPYLLLLSIFFSSPSPLHFFFFFFLLYTTTLPSPLPIHTQSCFAWPPARPPSHRYTLPPSYFLYSPPSDTPDLSLTLTLFLPESKRNRSPLAMCPLSVPLPSPPCPDSILLPLVSNTLPENQGPGTRNHQHIEETTKAANNNNNE